MQYLVEIITHYRFTDGDGKTRGTVVKTRMPAMHLGDAKDIASALRTNDYHADVQRDCFVVVKYHFQHTVVYIAVDELMRIQEDLAELQRCYERDCAPAFPADKPKLKLRLKNLPEGWEKDATAT